MAEDEEAPRALVEAMARHESAGCQEHATYLVMALAHGGGGGRALRWRMRQLGAVQALLEVSLLGSPLARSRAAKILQWFKDDGQGRIKAYSGPRMKAAPPTACHGNDGDGDEGLPEHRGQDSEAEPEHEHEVHHALSYGVRGHDQR